MIPPVPQTVEESPSSWNVVIPMQYGKCSQGLLLRELCRPIDWGGCSRGENENVSSRGYTPCSFSLAAISIIPAASCCCCCCWSLESLKGSVQNSFTVATVSFFHPHSLFSLFLHHVEKWQANSFVFSYIRVRINYVLPGSNTTVNNLTWKVYLRIFSHTHDIRTQINFSRQNFSIENSYFSSCSRHITVG